MSKRLYQVDSYKTSFRAKVLSISPYENNYAVTLDATIFYPESGGQPCDVGELGGLGVGHVIESPQGLLHIVEGKPSFEVGDEVEGKIDWSHRFVNMQQHTGQHILSQAFLRELGARTVSSRLGVDHSTIDIDKLDLTWDGVRVVEHLANSIVYEDRAIKIYEARAEDVQGLRVKRQVDRKILRIVEVDGFDKSPCGGTHCRRTGEVGLIKILRWEKVRDTSRVEFLCGRLAEDDYFWKSRFVVELAQEMTTKDTNIPGKVHAIIEQHKSLTTQVEKLRKKILRYEACDLESEIEEFNGLGVLAKYMSEKDPAAIRAIALELTQKPGRVVMLACGEETVHFVFSRSRDVGIDMRPLILKACEVVGGKGGGRANVCEGGGGNPKDTLEALEKVKKELLEIIARA